MIIPTFFVGSHNPVKIEAVRVAIRGHWPDTAITGIEVESGVSSQPMTDEETRLGSENRARLALAAGLKQQPELAGTPNVLGIGLEGGVFAMTETELWSTVWVSVYDHTGQFWSANGGRIKVPTIISDLIQSGEEMGTAVQDLTGVSDVRTKQGMFGVITNNFVTRTEEYASVAKIALGIWYGQDWQQTLLGFNIK